MSISVCLHRKNLIEPPKKSWLPVVSVAERRKWIPDLDSADQKKLDETSPIRKIIVILRIQDSLSRISWNYRTKKMFKINTFFSKLVHFDLKNQNPMCISTCRHRKTQISRKKSFSRISEVFRFTDQFKYITYYRLRQIRWGWIIFRHQSGGFFVMARWCRNCKQRGTKWSANGAASPIAPCHKRTPAAVSGYIICYELVSYLASGFVMKFL